MLRNQPRADQRRAARTRRVTGWVILALIAAKVLSRVPAPRVPEALAIIFLVGTAWRGFTTIRRSRAPTESWYLAVSTAVVGLLVAALSVLGTLRPGPPLAEFVLSPGDSASLPNDATGVARLHVWGKVPQSKSRLEVRLGQRSTVSLATEGSLFERSTSADSFDRYVWVKIPEGAETVSLGSTSPLENVHAAILKDPVPFTWLSIAALVVYLGALLIGRSLDPLRNFPAVVGSLLTFGFFVHQAAAPNASVLLLVIGILVSLTLHELIRAQMQRFGRMRFGAAAKRSSFQ